jgi:parvulin-like peptidyl-prolyl isomerase
MGLYVNGQAVPSERIEQEKERMRPAYEQAFADPTDSQREQRLEEWARENVIEQVLFQQAAQREFPEIAASEIDDLLNRLLDEEPEDGPLHQRLSGGEQERQKVRQQAAEQIRSERLLEKICCHVGEPKDKEIRRYYQRHLERFSVPELVRAAHIVLHADPNVSAEQQKQQMDELLARIQKGADFAALADEHSACPGNGGDLGYFPRGRMVSAFEQVVFALQPGQVSGVFATEFGWHIAKVLDRKPEMPCPLEQVRPVIVKELTQQARDKALEQFLDAERKKAVVEHR